MALGSVVVNSWVDVEVIGVCVIVEVTFGRTGIGVAVAGDVTRRSNCCPDWMMEAEVIPFQAIRFGQVEIVQIRNPGEVFAAFDIVTLMAVAGRGGVVRWPRAGSGLGWTLPFRD